MEFLSIAIVGFFYGLYWIFLAVFVMYIGNFRFFDVVFM
uniref:Uncharacterized protein n=1 Tax=virus sp. ctiha2 TaxID=2827299 RepID=A0A8S5RGH1_9VIRU|nr:MAG TPA: hypothetical protein [virus sp. ctiha2]DAE89657.1 MAG TPA: hypothetical protein [Bacteriophage sp.]